MEEREGDQDLKVIFHRVIEFQSWMECWDLFREISVSLKDFILKSSTSIAQC